MPNISEIVEVQIVLQAAAVAQANFGTPLILGDSSVLSGRTAKYSSLSAMTSDGWAGTEPEYIMASKVFSQNPHPVAVVVGKKVAPDAHYSDTLDVVLNARSDWYAILCETRDETEVLGISAWAEANARVFVTSTDDSEVASTTLSDDTGSIAKLLHAAGYSRTMLFYSGSSVSEYIEAAVVGILLPKTPGSYTAKFKTLAGITADALTDSQYSNILEKCTNAYTTIGGVAMVANGTMTKNAVTFFDIMVFADWIKAKIEERVFGVFSTLDKVPYTDAGVAAVESQVKAVLNQGIANGGIAADPAPTTSVPRVADVAPADKAGRHLPDIRFEATLAGAIHSTKISGVLIA